MINMCSIVILTYNALEYTKKCVDSIIKYTLSPYEFVFVDNGSSDGTFAFLKTLPGRKSIIRNTVNQGFAKGCNQGAAKAKGDTLLFLNNDTVVTNRWLNNLLYCLNSNQKIGAVVPCSNFAAGAQIDVQYHTMKEMQDFARGFNVSNPLKWKETNSASGFCLLSKKMLFNGFGGFDEQFILGGYEDIDLTLRIFQAGYKIIVAGDTFIHHFGNRTFQANKIDIMHCMRKNSERFHQKFPGSK